MKGRFMATQQLAFTDDHKQQLTNMLLGMRHKFSLELHALDGRMAKVALGTDITICSNHPADSTDGCIRQEEHVAKQLTDGRLKIIKKIDEAIRRVEKGEYGYCSECEEPIPIMRLKAVPFADKCVQCKSLLERSMTILKSGSEVRVDKMHKMPQYT